MSKQTRRALAWKILKNWRFILVVMAVSLFLLQNKTHRIQGESMFPSLAEGDYILVNKRNTPTRYAMVIIDPEIPRETSYVKRVIGMPGDELAVEQNVVYLQSKEAKRTGLTLTDRSFASELPDSLQKFDVTDEVARNLRRLGKIPDDCYFVLGDNRQKSKDRRQFGLIRASQIKGMVIYRYYPFDKIGNVQ
ncbi:signal peptidase I [Enterococcus sp. DIV0212c]|uniref:signal peptidase I n=1 Tax=Enterococcus sp. DIV0212c TaxID=2230867 RepID=UPI001A9B8990|nr:signal peptidase I [Enterococcus sp. DIV0212c]MBO1355270.1 signal peptidase I [Enterococcus sp. DIV0212c]